MSKINNQSNLFNIEGVQDICSESAASYSGGIRVYTGANFTGQVRTAKGVPDLRVSDRMEGVKFNNEISSIKNDTDKPWAFYKKAGFSGERFTLQPGQSRKFVGRRFNDTITSYRSIS